MIKRTVELFAVGLLLVSISDWPVARADFSNNFDSNNAGWNLSTDTYQNAVQHASPYGGITANVATGGTGFATAPMASFESGSTFDTRGSAMTNWGGYSNNFNGGFTSSVDIYLNVGGNWANDTRFAWDTAISSSDTSGPVAFLCDFVFNVGYYNSVPGSGLPGFVIDAENNTGRASSNPLTADYRVGEITTSGWYTFQETFMNIGGVLDVAMSISSTDGTVMFAVPFERDDNKDHDLIATVGGNNYGWFASNEFSLLAFDNAKLSYVGSGSEMAISRQALFSSLFADAIPVPEPASAVLGGSGAIGLLLVARRRKQIARDA